MPDMQGGGENPMEAGMTGMSTGMEWAGKAQEIGQQFNPSG